MDININSYIPITSVEGPGKRFCIWVQGCQLRCSGCANSHMWDSANGTMYDVETIISLIKKYSDKIEGITFLGGEPLEQIIPVTYIAQKVQEMGLSVIVFTGYTHLELKNNSNFQTLSKYIDILIDGRYDSAKQDYTRPWVGSTNQNYYFYSNKYSKEILKQYKNKIEVRVVNNKVTLTGMGNFSQLESVV